MNKLSWIFLCSFLHVSCSTPTIRKTASVGESLYRNEQWLNGSHDEEIKAFTLIAQQTTVAQMQLQKQMSTKTSMAPQGRVFHNKQNGCLIGEYHSFEKRPLDLKDETNVGAFKVNKSYKVLARYSNGVGLIQPDNVPDVRGLAFKFLDVEDEVDQVNKSVDFAMTDSPIGFGRDIREFADFMVVAGDPGPGKINIVKFFLNHPQVFNALYPALKKFAANPADLTYWSGHPYLFGFDKAFKLKVIPENADAIEASENEKYSELLTENSSESSKVKLLNQHYAGGKWPLLSKINQSFSTQRLRLDLEQRAMKNGIRYTIAVQLEKDPVSTPIGDDLKPGSPGSLKIWSEKDSTPIPVGEVVFPPQDMNDPELDALCSNARFTPGHYVSQHRPLSNVGRGRIYAYQASANGRGASENEVSSEQLQQILNRIKK